MISINGRSFQVEDLRSRLFATLREDGLIGASDERFELERRKGRLEVNGRRQSQDVYERYSDMLDDVGINTDTDITLEMDKSSTDVSLVNGSNRTTLSFND